MGFLNHKIDFVSTYVTLQHHSWSINLDGLVPNLMEGTFKVPVGDSNFGADECNFVI